MCPRAFTENSQYEPKHTPPCDCEACRARAVSQFIEDYELGGFIQLPEPREVTAWMRWQPIRNALICSIVIAACLAGAIWAFTGISDAKTPKPVAAPQSLLRARAACGNHDTPVKCRTALRHAYEALSWQKHARQHAQAMTVQAITRDAITWAAAKYHVNATEMLRVGQCESHLWPFATNGQYAGWAQLSTRHRADPIFAVVPWQDAYAEASHVARYVKAHGWGEWQCRPEGGLRW